MTKIADQQRMIRNLKRHLADEEECQTTLIAVSGAQELAKRNIDQAKTITELQLKLETAQAEIVSANKKAKLDSDEHAKKYERARAKIH